MATTYRNRQQLFLEAEGYKFQLLGDPHLGRKFKTGVPLDRRGEREAQVWQTFKHNLQICDESVTAHICMGDLFDKFRVDNETLLGAIEAYQEAAQAHPNTHYYVIQGNHDASKDADKVSSFDIFSEIINLSKTNKTTVRSKVSGWGYPIFLNGQDVVFLMPYDPFLRASEQAKELVAYVKQYNLNCVAVFGHWDIDDFGTDNPNLVPAGVLSQVTKVLVTGHVHQATQREIAGCEVFVTGSMEPYSFAEDPEGKQYLTLTLDELLAADLESFKNKCLRVKLKKGEELPEIDCLQLIAKRGADRDAEEETIEVKMIDFDLGKILTSELKKAGVKNQTVVEEVLNEFHRLKEHSDE